MLCNLKVGVFTTAGGVQALKETTKQAAADDVKTDAKRISPSYALKSYRNMSLLHMIRIDTQSVLTSSHINAKSYL